MGPGLLGQLIDMSADARLACLRCHAPLAEQSQSLTHALATGANAQDAKGLHSDGIVCAACHVRALKWYGPPRRDGSTNILPQTPHGGFTASTAFEDARFCSACHQFEDDGFALNGKLLENTFNEWSATKYATAGITCQTCHMPNRAHSFKGIHDRDATRAGLTIHAGAATDRDGEVRATLTVQNSGVGHHFPTYVTPTVTLHAEQLNANGDAIEGTEQQYVIARKVPLNLSKEIFDTRIPAGGKAQLVYSQARHADARDLRFEIHVAPDAFYKDFFAALLRGTPSAAARPVLHQALEDTQRSPYELYAFSQPIADVSIPSLVYVDAGDFIMGSDNAEREYAYRLDEAAYGHQKTREQGWYSRELARGRANIDGYAITVSPITNAQYAEFIADTGHRAPDVDAETWASYRLVHPYERTRRFAWLRGEIPQGREDHPVVLVSMDDALAYATWLSRKTGRSFRLPSEQEWEKAARGVEGLRFPWGDEFDPARLNSHDQGPFDTTAVGTFPSGKSPFGISDGAGLVFEWTATPSGSRMVVKGGSWDDKGCGVCRPAARHSRPRALKHILIGFRLVLQ